MKKYYKFKIYRDVSVFTNIKLVTFENEWLKIEPNGKVTVKANKIKAFAWDGCTPKIEWKDIVIGTPDGVIDYETRKPKTYYGSLMHDALYQFAPRNLVTRKQVDQVMLQEMNYTDFKLAKIYYFLIRCFGWYYWNKYSKK